MEVGQKKEVVKRKRAGKILPAVKVLKNSIAMRGVTGGNMVGTSDTISKQCGYMTLSC